MSQASKVTIKEVAKLAGVSVGTVSRVINNASNCPPATRERVLQAIKALNYIPNQLARNLKKQTTDNIGFVVPDIANPTYVNMAKTIQETAKAARYRLSLMSTDASVQEEIDALKSLQYKHVDGLILVSLAPSARLLQAIRQTKGPVVAIGNFPDDSGIDNVRVDSAAGVIKAIDHLIGQARQHIAFINGTRNTVPATSRMRGYCAGLQKHHLPYREKLLAQGDFTMQGGYAAMRALLERDVTFDALFCASDLMAFGALRALSEIGMNVPDDVAVIGMDDIELSKVATPTLTSVSLLAAERGRLAAELLIERIRHPERPPQLVTVHPRLIIRESSTDYITVTSGKHDHDV